MKLPIRQVLIFSFAFEVFAAVGFIGFLSYKHSQTAIHDVAEKWRGEISNRIESYVADYLNTAQLMNQISKKSLVQNKALNDLSQIKSLLYQQMRSFESVPYTAWGSNAGDYIGILRTPDQRYHLEMVSPATQGQYRTYELKPDGSLGKLVKTFPRYDPRLRPWYRTAIAAKGATWSPVYVWFDGSKIAIDAVLPVQDTQGQTLGVIDTPIPLSNISQFLRQLQISPGGQSFILDHTGKIVASSHFDPLFQTPNASLNILDAQHSTVEVIQKTATYLINEFGGLSKVKSPLSFSFQNQDHRQFVRVVPFNDHRGLNWLICVVIPEADFMEPIWANSRLTLLIAILALFIAIMVGIITAQWITDPIIEINQASKAIAEGKLDQQVNLGYKNEIGDLANSFNQMATKLKQVFRELEFKTLHDHLTGLPNRVQLMKRLREALTRSQTYPYPIFALFFLDLDDFKVVNDSLGHLVGDELLKQVSHRLGTCVRPSDCVARFGGDEFVILVENINNIADVIKIAQRILTQLNHPFTLEHHQIFSSTSIGITISTMGYSQPEEVLRDADIAMYSAKQSDKGRYQIMTTAMQVTAIQRFKLEHELRDALKNEEFCLFYQPIICLATGQLAGFEALIRWQHPVHGLISPGEFIPLAEEIGLIKALDLWALQAACEQMHQWQLQFPRSSPHSFMMSVNFSPIELMQRNIVEIVTNIIRRYHFKQWYLKLEITENSLIDTLVQIKVLQELKNLNIKLSLDDFGTGYSSLSRLHRFPIDTLKIDRSFVNRIHSEAEGESIVNAIITLAHNLKMDVIAEGIETVLERDTLKALGCEFGQGYLFAKPLAAAAATQLIQDSLATIPYSCSLRDNSSSSNR
ncbi:MAG: EAL domain-containing protein [Snowella sp.]|nr:EAL domain-containing protein [Snowella sp.]